jgi:hypothetical protein
VSSFANSLGGDLVIGVEESDGLPVAVPGVTVPNIDDEIQRLQQMILYGTEPRLTGIDIKPVPLRNANTVLVVRVPRSWNAPHRVILEGHDKFYARDTNGKHPMNVDELREAFTLADRVEQRIRAFRTRRFEAIKLNKTVEHLANEATLILHLIPLSAATSRETLKMTDMREKQHLLAPLGSGGNGRINLDGFIVYSPNLAADGTKESSNAYTQLYRTGAVEAVMSIPEQQGEQIIPSEWYEECVMDALSRYLRALRELEVIPPVYLFLGFANVGGYRFAVNRSLFFPAGPRGSGYLDRGDIELGEIAIEDLSDETATLLVPLFDQVWQAFGFARSFNFSADGKWTGQRR